VLVYFSVGTVAQYHGGTPEFVVRNSLARGAVIIRAKSAAVGVLLMLPLAGALKRPPAADLAPVASSPRLDPATTALRSRGAALFQEGRYAEAAETFLMSYRQAREQGAPNPAARSLNSAGAAWLAMFEYAAARRAFVEARSMAEALRDWDLAAAVSVNAASLELQAGSLEGARAEAQRALAALERSAQPRYRAEALGLAAMIESAERGIDRARPRFRAAIDEADRTGNDGLRARLWNQLGFAYLDAGRLEEAEAALVEAFRLRRLLAVRELSQSYRALGLLRLAQGDLEAAGWFMDRALEDGRRRPGRVPLWAAHYGRGQVYRAQREATRALEEFRAALEDARRWRVRVLPPDAARLSAEAGLEQVCAAFIETAVERHFATGRGSLSREAFEAAEDCRASALRARLRGERGSGPAGLLERARETLGSSDALFSFQLGEPHSIGWVLTREGLKVRRLAGRGRLLELAGRLRLAVANGSQEASRVGALLYGELFGAEEGSAAGKPRWIIAAEDALTELPFPALVASERGGTRFLIEQHSLELVPSATLLLAHGGGRPDRNARFIGVADPIYNTADPRFPAARLVRPAAQLPRLAGSIEEVRACARSWGGAAPILLDGPAASRRALQEAIGKTPTVIHFATHVVRAPEPPAHAAIALSIAPTGEPELLDPEDIASWTLQPSSVVALSGCASGAPEGRPRIYASGLAPARPTAAPARAQGALARAWLAAGAGAVAASLCPTPDDAGGLFVTVYGRLGAGLDAAGALRDAQLGALRSGTWRSAPSYWAAYFLVGRE
jgi:CHAT domain-containing protein/tetratricopeptide (TPR) repeat protein